MVTCEVSRVWCWLRRSPHNRQHVQCTRRKKSLSRAEKTALAAFRKRSVRVVWNEDLLREKGGNINVNVKLQVTYAQDIQHSTDTAWPPPPPSTEWTGCPPQAPFVMPSAALRQLVADNLRERHTACAGPTAPPCHATTASTAQCDRLSDRGLGSRALQLRPAVKRWTGGRG